VSGKEFCAPDNFNYPKWNAWDVFKWRALSEKLGGGHAYLAAYKGGWVVYNKDRIADIAKRESIPPVLLASVAWAEVGGKPDGIKKPLFFERSMQQRLNGKGYAPGTYDRPAGNTSVGAVSIQMRNAARELGLSIEAMTFSDQVTLLDCLNTDVFNLTVVARHLRGLILHDYPGADTANLTNEQFIVAGARYNRGTDRPLADIMSSLKLPPGTKGREYSEYGRRMVEHREHVARLLSTF
jgi:hypothetical protein